MISLNITNPVKVELPKRPKNKFAINVSFMHGDGDLDTEECVKCDYAEAVKLTTLFKALVNTDTYSEGEAKAVIVEVAKELGLDPNETWDEIYDMIPADITNEGGLASVQDVNITWWNESGIEYEVEIVNEAV
jgi:Zn ribbon nucleic-acid-binding protein